VSDAVRFRARLEPEAGGTFVVVPDEMAERIGARGRTSVRGTVNGTPFRNQVMPYRDDSPQGRRWYMVVSRAVRAAAGGLEAGDEVELVLQRDDEPRTADVPAELSDALDRDPRARLAWEAIAPSHRNEYAAWVGEAKRQETRHRRAAVTVKRMAERMRSS
jgi:hypothetical protein